MGKIFKTFSTIDFKKDLIKVYIKHGFGGNTLQSLCIGRVFSEHDITKTAYEIANELGVTEEPEGPRLIELMEE